MGYEQSYTRQTGPYRSRHGMFFGVCKGLADYFNFSVFWTRFFTVLAFLFTGLWPVGIGYVIAGFLMKLEPVLPLETPMQAEFYNAYAASPNLAAQRLKRSFESLDRRLQRIENIVTDKSYDWDQRLNGC